MLPKVFTEFRMRLVRLNACIRPCCFRFLSTHRVLSVVASKPVSNMFTTMAMSRSRFLSLRHKSL